MAKVPFSAQRVSSGGHPLQHLELLLQRGGYLSGDQLARLVESTAGQPLPPWLADYLARHLRGQVRRPKGRPARSKAALEISLYMADWLYYRLLPRHQREVQQRKAADAGSRRRSAESGDNDDSASELAYKEVLRRMRKDFPNIDWKALRNKLAEWRSGKYLHAHPDEGDEFSDAY